MMRFVERAASLWLLWSKHRILDEGSRNRTDGCSFSGARRRPSGRNRNVGMSWDGFGR